MKKKYFLLILISTIALNIWSCGLETDKAESTEMGETSEAVEISIESCPTKLRINYICELTTMEYYFHNVAKSTKEPGTGILHWGEVERTFWIEYTGVVQVGIDASDVDIQVEGTTVTVTMPEAKILSSSVEAISEDGYYVSEDSWFNSNPITAEEQTTAVATAQADMIARVENSDLISSAQSRAMQLIENYIEELGTASGVEYEIIWE